MTPLLGHAVVGDRRDERHRPGARTSDRAHPDAARSSGPPASSPRRWRGCSREAAGRGGRPRRPRDGRADLSLPGHPEVLALGDMVAVRDADGAACSCPGVAPVAMQQGRYAARVVRARLAGRRPAPFRYVDKGNLATIGRARAVADLKGVHLSGLLAWLTWLVVHLFYLSASRTGCSC